MKKLLIFLVLMVGCDKAQPSETDERFLARSLVYFKDNRTNLCFAKRSVPPNGFGFDGGNVTNVPCTPEVEKLISLRH
jgi:hypothetical protein